MADDRRRMSIEEKEELAKIIAEAINLRQPPTECHAFSEDERYAIRDLVKVKKKAIQTGLWVVGAITIWTIKEVGTFIYSHVAFGWLGK